MERKGKRGLPFNLQFRRGGDGGGRGEEEE